MLRLAQRIASMEPLFSKATLPTVADVEKSKPNVDHERKLICRSPCIIADEVAVLYGNTEKEKWNDSDFPNVAPPFDVFFVEWTVPQAMRIRDQIVPVQMKGQEGFLCYSLKSDSPYFKAHAERAVTWGVTVPPLTHWMILASYWIADFSCGGMPTHTGLVATSFVSSSGERLDSMISTVCNDPEIMKACEGSVGFANDLVSLVLSFCHCKNVVISDTPSEPILRRHQKPVPRIKFKTLNIYPMREHIRKAGEGENGKTDLKKALHICRGHFATYTPDHPLFGKYVGTFWKPQHVRGNLAAGAVVKKYAVKV